MEPIRDPIEAAARALAKHKSLAWVRIPETWREEQRAQARVMLEAADLARASGWVDLDDGDVPSALDDKLLAVGA